MNTSTPAVSASFKLAVGRAKLCFCALIIFLAFAVLYGTSTLLPTLLESLFGYDAFAFFYAFLIFAVLAVVLAFLVLLMKRSVAEKAAHLAAE